MCVLVLYGNVRWLADHHTYNRASMHTIKKIKIKKEEDKCCGTQVNLHRFAHTPFVI